MRPVRSVQTPDERALEISRHYADSLEGVDIYKLLDQIDALKALPEDQFLANRQQYEDFVFLSQYHLRYLAEIGHALNDQLFEETEETAFDHLRFPREWFMAYAPETPTFKIGDIVWSQTERAGILQPVQEVVISSVITDICGILYMVAPYDGSVICEVIGETFTEEQLAFRKEDLDPRRKRFEVIK